MAQVDISAFNDLYLRKNNFGKLTSKQSENVGVSGYHQALGTEVNPLLNNQWKNIDLYKISPEKIHEANAFAQLLAEAKSGSVDKDPLSADSVFAQACDGELHPRGLGENIDFAV